MDRSREGPVYLVGIADSGYPSISPYPLLNIVTIFPALLPEMGKLYTFASACNSGEGRIVKGEKFTTHFSPFTPEYAEVVPTKSDYDAMASWRLDRDKLHHLGRRGKSKNGVLPLPKWRNW